MEKWKNATSNLVTRASTNCLVQNAWTVYNYLPTSSRLDGTGRWITGDGGMSK